MAREGGKDRGLFERPKDSGVWWIRYHDQYGNEHREKIGSKSAARQAYAKRKTEVLSGKKLPQLNRRPLTVADLIKNHLDEMILDKPAQGKASYRAKAEFWRKELGKQVAEDVQPGEIERVKAKLLGTGLAPATVNRSTTFLRRLFSLAVRDKEVTSNPLTQGRVKQLREANRRERFFTEEEEIRLFDSSGRAWWQIIQFSLHTGLRRAEQLALRREHINLPFRQMLVTNTKNGEQEWVRMNSVVVQLLQDVMASHSSEWLFPGRTPDRKRDGSAVSRRFKNHLERLEIHDASWHTLRHTFISRLAMLGTPLPTLQKFARHKSITMTMRYSHLLPSHEEQSLEALAKTYPARTRPARGQNHDENPLHSITEPALKPAPAKNDKRESQTSQAIEAATSSAL